MYKPTIKALCSNLPILFKSHLKSTPSHKCRQITIMCSLHLTGRSFPHCAQCDCFCPFALDCVGVLLALLSISSTSHLCFYLVTPPPYLSFLGCLTTSSPCVTFCSRSLLCSLSLSHSRIHPHLVSPVFSSFLICVTLHIHSPPPPTPHFSLSRECCYQK